MANSASSEKALVVVGPGERLEELSAALAGLIGRFPGGGARLVALEDLAQLLLLRAESGRLILDGDAVPAEDIGILRRFLEGRPHWSLAVVGASAQAGGPRALLGLPGTRFVAWPPHLDDLRELAGAAPAAAPPREAAASRAAGASPSAAPAPTPRAPERASGAAAPEGSASASAGEIWNLASLIDDLIVGRSVSETAAAYALGPIDPLPMRCARGDVTEILGGFLTLAEACAGPGKRVALRARGDGSDAVVEILFPPGDLTDGDLPALLQDGPFEGPRKLRAAAESARTATLMAEELGGRAALRPSKPGELRLEVRLPLAGAGAPGEARQR